MRANLIHRTILLALLAAATLSADRAHAQNAAAAADNVERDLIRVKAAETPWLKINAKGSTGAVKALAFTPDSKRLMSAGLDKVVHVWNLTAAGRDLKRVMLRERTIHWQVARGPRGSIYTIAAAPNDGLLALAGYGAMGILGEIMIVDPVQGNMVTMLHGLDKHRDAVLSMSFSNDGNFLVSCDANGQTILWDRGGNWAGRTVTGNDVSRYGEATAKLIDVKPKVRPVAIVGNTHVVVPAFTQAQGGRLLWKLQRFDIANPKDVKTLPTVHYGQVTALTVSADGARMASADLEGNLHLWDLARGTSVVLRTGDPQKLADVYCSLAFSPNGASLAAGTLRRPHLDAAGQQIQSSVLELWDVPARRVARARSLEDHVHSVAISPDGKQLAYVGGVNYETFVESLAGGDQTTVLQGVGRRITKVAFAKDEPYYRIAYGMQLRDITDNADPGHLEATFDTDRVELGPKVANEKDWILPDFWKGNWRLEKQASGVWQLYSGNQPRGFIPVDPRVTGIPEDLRRRHLRSYCWIPDAQGNPVAVAVGTDLENNVLVYGLAQRGECPLLRQFRGHEDFITSIGISRDRRYLVSGSADATIRVWSLADLEKAATTAGRWGGIFAVQNELTVGNLNEAGPLFRKGMRKGDLVTEVSYRIDGKEVVEKRPAEMLRHLQTVADPTPVLFRYRRGQKDQTGFVLISAWPPVATLFVTKDQEWAYWTTEGYYDASANGHTMFGWQVNRGIDKLPDYYRADQYRRTLERPDVMEQLLKAGSLPEAFRRAAQQPPAEPEVVLAEHISATPIVQILNPKFGEVVNEASTKVRAQIRLPGKGQMVSARVFANGVVAPNQQLVAQKEVEGGKEVVYEWDVALPADQRNLIQVIVGTDAPTAAFSNVMVSRTEVQQLAERPRLFVLSVGVNEYKDKNIQPLSYSVADAEAIVSAFKAKAAGLYTVAEPTLMVNEDVTRNKWQTSFTDLAKSLKAQVRPNDLLVLFLAGHGFVDPKDQKYYYASYDLTVDDYIGGTFKGCISWSDFSSLSDIPCRKLAFLDTCHSGAIQPLRERNLKAAIRDFQEDVVFTVTASTGSEKSAENPAWGHGAFTKCLLEALDGKADVSRDGVVTLTEVIEYVKTAVPDLTADGQHPTAAPDELLPYISLGLTGKSRLVSEAPGLNVGPIHNSFGLRR